MSTSTRTDDERQIAILRMHVVDGLTMSEIGKRTGMSRSAVAGLFKRIKDDDFALSGEPRPDVDAFYQKGNCEVIVS